MFQLETYIRGTCSLVARLTRAFEGNTVLTCNSSLPKNPGSFVGPGDVSPCVFPYVPLQRHLASRGFHSTHCGFRARAHATDGFHVNDLGQ